MVRAAVVLALAGLIALVIALLTGSTVFAVLVIVLAIIGIVRLLRDWRSERRRAADQRGGPPLFQEDDTDASHGSVTPDEFSPDISTDPGGPSSDARAD